MEDIYGKGLRLARSFDFQAFKLGDGFSATWRDVTERKRMEEALRLSEERYRRLFEVESDAIFLVDCESDEFIDANPAAQRMYGYSLEEFLSLKMRDVSERPDKALKATSAHEEHIPLCWHRRKDGTVFPVEIAGNYFDCHGRMIHVAAIRDITTRKKIESRLKQSESRYRTLFKHSPIPTLEEDYSKVKSYFDMLRSSEIIDFREYFHSHPGEVASLASMVKVLDINQEGREFFEIHDAVLIPSSRSAYFQESGLDVLIEELAALAEGNTRFESETPIKTMEGDIKIVSLNLSVVPGYENTLSRVLVSLVDATERRRAEDALGDSEEKYRLVVENANEGIILAQDGFIKFANRGMAKLLGRTIEEIIARPFQEFIYPDDRAMVVERHKRRIAGEQIEDLYAFRIVTGDGSMRWVEISAVRIEWQGHPATLNFLSDITKRKMIEDDLRRSREKYHNIFENSILGLYQSIPEGRYLSVNPAFAHLFGYDSPEEMIASVIDIGCQLYVNPQDRERAIKTLIEQGFLEGFELEVRRRDGAKFWISMNTRIVQDENGTHFDGTVEDITKRKQAEVARDLLVKELESKNIEMERFIYTVSHDLRSPLVTISGFTGFLKSDLLEGNLGGADIDLNVINSTVAKMDLLLRDTLELSRIGRIVNPPDIVSFEDVAREARNQLVELTRAKGVKVEVASDLPFVYVDHMRIVEVLANLIENSIKYMGDQTCPKIEIGYRQSDGTFFVRDNGIGIDPSQHHKIFELFYKIDGKSEGTGAGLAIVKRIIEVHGGHIWIESELGKGCMICFTLPLSINK